MKGKDMEDVKVSLAVTAFFAGVNGVCSVRCARKGLLVQPGFFFSILNDFICLPNDPFI